MISRQGVGRRFAVGACVAGVSLAASAGVRAQHVEAPVTPSTKPTTATPGAGTPGSDTPGRATSGADTSVTARAAARPPSARDIAAGEVLFARRCAVCHGPKGEGGRGPTLARATLPRVADLDSLLRIIQRGIEDTGMPSSRLTRPEVAQVAAFVLQLGRRPPEHVPGNATRGARLYAEKGGCAACHAIKGTGGAFGPDLSDVGRRRGAAFLRASLLDPEADVPKGFGIYRSDVSITENFLQVRVTTRDGRQVLGTRVNEDSFSIQLREASGTLHSFFKSELTDLQKDWGRSPMPPYRGVFTDAELDDLVAYLAGLVGQPDNPTTLPAVPAPARGVTP